MFDLNDKPIAEVETPKRGKLAPPRRLIWRGRAFVEGGGPDSFYGPGEFAEVAEPKDA